MNVFAKMDTSMVVGHFKGLNATDPEVLRSHYMKLRSSMELYHKLLLIPLILGIIQAIAGVIGLIIIIGVFLFIPAAIFGGGGWWMRKRLVQNMAALDEGYNQYAATLKPAS